MTGAGALTALLEQLAAAPEAGGPAWSRGLQPGERLDRFEVIGELGRGGFGVVCEALEEALRATL
jgi:hypothetical protein